MVLLTEQLKEQKLKALLQARGLHQEANATTLSKGNGGPLDPVYMFLTLLESIENLGGITGGSLSAAVGLNDENGVRMDPASEDTLEAIRLLSQQLSERLGLVGSAANAQGTLLAQVRAIAEKEAAGFTSVTYDVVGGASGLSGVWDVVGGKIYPVGSNSAIVIGSAAGEATNIDLATKVTSSTEAALTEVVSVEPLTLVQEAIPGGLTVPPNAGDTVTISVDPSGFVVGDGVLVAEVDPADGSTLRKAHFTVDSVAASSITLSLVIKSDSDPGGTYANAEITGQTRLPNIPADAISAHVSFGLNPMVVQSAVDASSSYYEQAGRIAYGGDPIAFWGFKAANVADIDFNTRYGTGSIPISGRLTVREQSNLAMVRIVSYTSLALRSSGEVVYWRVQP